MKPVSARTCKVNQSPRNRRATKPEPGPGENLCAGGRGVFRTDLLSSKGSFLRKKSPVIPGTQAVGHVAARGVGADRLSIGSRVGVAGCYRLDGTCDYCRRGEENLCDDPQFHGIHGKRRLLPNIWLARRILFYALP